MPSRERDPITASECDSIGYDFVEQEEIVLDVENSESQAIVGGEGKAVVTKALVDPIQSVARNQADHRRGYVAKPAGVRVGLENVTGTDLKELARP
jgi:hypothetical protein